MNPSRTRSSRWPGRAWPLGLSVCAVLLAAAPPLAAAEELGRLFFTPEHREALDRQRQSSISGRGEIPEDPALTIDGVVTRSSGKRTVWINGVARDDEWAGDGVAVIPERANPGRVVVRSGGSPPIRAGVGDTVRRDTGEAVDRLGGGRIRVEPGPLR
ncbi:MAG: hypothetical protein LBD06_07360 [Candidatus Accumulibacter sp.]|jgi:hypothetical protein|nr:hypothetical protein [Accumulibacter sp.]